MDVDDVIFNMAAPSELRVLELYSGVGGMHWAFQESEVPFTVVAAIDINTTANQVYRHNFPHVKLLPSSIDKITDTQFEGWHIDAILMSPPCQPFTRMGKKRDVEDIRTKSFLHVLHLIQQAKNKPSYILVENVKGFEESEARGRLLHTLTQCCYHYQEFLLTPLQVGVPNCRLRYYLIATLKPDGFAFNTCDGLMDTLPEQASDWLKFKSKPHCDIRSCDQPSDQGVSTVVQNGVSDNESVLSKASESLRQVADDKHQHYEGCKRLDHFLEEKTKDFKQFLVGDKELCRFVIMDIALPFLQKSACFTRRYGHYVEGAGSLICMTTDVDVLHRVSGLKSDVVDQRLDLGEKELNILRQLQLRYFTPREIANLLCFPPSFDFPSDLSTIQLYRCLGNSLNVHMVSLLIKLMTL